MYMYTHVHIGTEEEVKEMEARFEEGNWTPLLQTKIQRVRDR